MKNKPLEPRLKPYNANLDIWQYMGYSVAKTLHLRPYEVLTTWSACELLIAFGVYMNERNAEKYAEYQSLDPKTKASIKDKPKEYAIKFVTFEQFGELMATQTEEFKQQTQAEVDEERLRVEEFMKGLDMNV